LIIFEDLKHKSVRYFGSWSFKELYRTLRTDGTSAVFLYRLSQFLQNYHMGILAILVRYLNRFLNACWIGKNAQFGPGFVIMHPYGVVINSNVKGAANIIIQSGVVIGVDKDGTTNVPILGSDVYIGAGAKLIGNIKIGNNVLIGANAVIQKDIPDNSISVGVPGKNLRKSK
jgi:serine O-acetyltransferase